MKTSIITTHFWPDSNKPPCAIAEIHRPINYKMLCIAFALIVVGVFLTGCDSAVSLEPTATRAASALSVLPSATVGPSTTPTPTAHSTLKARPPTLTPTQYATFINRSIDNIAFASCDMRLASCEIFVLNADGSHVIRLDDSQVIRLTDNNIDDCCPDWSPDGSKIVFVRGSDSTSEIWVMDAEGSNPTRLTSNDYPDGYAVWSPDGTKIAFLALQPNGHEIKAMNADGSNQITLATSGPDEGYFESPSWSPDGAKIAFVRVGFDGLACQGCSEIFVMNADGSNPIQITDNNSISQNPAWSPDGTKIAYETYVGSREVGIVVMNSDGGGQTVLANTEEWDGSPVWSPDGTKIAFESGRDYGRSIYVMNADGSNTIRLFEYGHSPVWSLGGTKIAFIEEVKGYIYVMNADGSGLIDRVSLTRTSSFSWGPILPTPTPFGPDCPLGWTRLTAGILAQVSKTSNVNDPLLSFIAQLFPSTNVKVLEGPVCADGIIFWKVESDLIPGGEGWMAEGDSSVYFLEPYQAQP